LPPNLSTRKIRKGRTRLKPRVPMKLTASRGYMEILDSAIIQGIVSVDIRNFAKDT